MMQHISALRAYYDNQLGTRKLHALLQGKDKKYFVGGELRTQIILRKTYALKITVKKVQVRRAPHSIRAYVEVQFSMRDTRIFIGVPSHIFASYFRYDYKI